MDTPKSAARKDGRSVRAAGGATKPDAAEGYSAHRERQRRRLLAAAEALFAAEGIDRISMLQITSAAGVQPSTLYQYFRSKEEIVWAVTEEVLQDFSNRAQVRIEKQGTGLHKLQTLLDLMAEDLEQRPQHVRFMAQFDVLYARELPVETLLRVERQMGLNGFNDFRNWVKQGIADGSFRPGLNPKVTLHAVLNAAIGTQRRLASLGDKVKQEYGQSATVLFRETVRVLLQGLCAGPEAEHAFHKSGDGPKRKLKKGLA